MLELNKCPWPGKLSLLLLFDKVAFMVKIFLFEVYYLVFYYNWFIHFIYKILISQKKIDYVYKVIKYNSEFIALVFTPINIATEFIIMFVTIIIMS